MSEEKPKTIDKEEVEETKEPTIVDHSVALVIAERDDAIKKLDSACDEIESLRKKLAAAEAILEEDLKAGIVNAIAPKTSVTKKTLSAMSIDELMKWKSVLDVANVPAFQSGTPVKHGKLNARQKLDDTFKDNMKLLKGDKF